MSEVESQVAWGFAILQAHKADILTEDQADELLSHLPVEILAAIHEVSK